MIRRFTDGPTIEPIVKTSPEPIIAVPIETVSIAEPIVTKLPLDFVAPVPVADVKTAVLALAETATESVKAVRDSFAAGIAPLQVASSASVSSYITAFAVDPLAANIVKSTAQLGLSTSTAGSSVPPPRAELDSAEVFEDSAGVLDQFSVELVVSLPVDKLPDVAFVKVMRAKVGPVKAVRPSISALIDAPSLPSSGKGFDPIAAAAFQAAGNGVGNKLTDFVVDDPNSLQRAVASVQGQVLRPTVPPPNTNKTSTSAGLISIEGADKSVLENLSFYLNRRTIGALPAPAAGTISIGNRVGINVLQGNSVSSVGPGIVQASNSMNFSEVGRVDLAGPSVRQIGGFLEASFVDRSVVYGAAFIYYVVCVGLDGAESPRSRLVNVSVVRNIPPPAPEVSFSIIGGHPRFVVRCPKGSSADHVEVFRSGRSVELSVRLGTDDSFMSEGPSTKVGQFWHLRDLGLGADRSTTFVDSGAVSGDRLSYRFYTVDAYGLKCQTPFSCSLRMPEHGQQIPIPVPSVTAEQAVGQQRVDVKMMVDDPRVAGFTVQRKDITISEKSIHQANQPEYVDIGSARDPKRAGSRRGPTLMDSEWPVYIPAANGSASFVDTTVRNDRVYQYAVAAIDIRGNKTLLVGSGRVGVYSRRIIDPPTAFAAQVSVDQGAVRGVLLTWTGGTNDFGPNSIMDDQDVLAATSVRSVFQVERRTIGAPFWDAMPATSESWFFDKVSTDPVPAFRPPYVSPGSSYEYRVLAMQSGGLVSPRSDVLSVAVIPPPSIPETVFVRSTPLNINPFAVVVSWNMPSEFVERWEVERAATNKIFGQQIPSMSSEAAKNLPYVSVASITPESSRARALSADTKDLDPNVYVGNRFYVDGAVSRHNSYFYRVRTVSAKGVTSDWAYGGVNLIDSAFDQKFYSTLSDDVKVALATNVKPIGPTTPLEPITPLQLKLESISTKLTKGIL